MSSGRVSRTAHIYGWTRATTNGWTAAGPAPEIATLLLEHLDTPDDTDAVAPLFRNVTGRQIPPRSAYWAGDRIAQDLLQQGYELRDLLSIPAEDARALVATWAAAHLGPAG